MVQISMSSEEATVLREVLESYVSDLRMENSRYGSEGLPGSRSLSQETY